jgi:hypothetical protein
MKFRSDVDLYLFSSNSQPLYQIDSLNSLALPNDWLQHYRYERKYVDMRILDGDNMYIPDQPKKYGPIRVIAISINQVKLSEEDAKTQGRSYAVDGMYPIRYGELESIKLEGDVVHFWFRLGDHVHYAEGDKLDSAIKQLSSEFVALLASNFPPAKYAVLGSPLNILPASSNSVAAFQSTVRVLSRGTMNPKLTIFTMLMSINENRIQNQDDGDPKYIKNAVKVQKGPISGFSGFEFNDNAVYTIEIASFNLERPGTSKGEAAVLVLRYDNAYFEAIGPTEIPVVSRYDSYQFALKPKRQTRDQWTTLKVNCIQKDVNLNNHSNLVSKESIAADEDILGLQWDIPVLVKADQERELWVFLAEFAVPFSAAVVTAYNIFKDSPLLKTNDWIKWVALAITLASVLLVSRKYWVLNRNS